ncbi:MAG: formate dehydrogenase accessory sulfurtransferase FdhD [Candidatus Nanopelagicales bacterium]
MSATDRRRIIKIRDGRRSAGPDDIAVEEALEIVVDGKRVSTTMRTPGHDIELAIGWLASEGIIESVTDTERVRECFDCETDADGDPYTRRSIHVTTRTKPQVTPRLHATSSACGLCGDDLIALTLARGEAIPTGSEFDLESVLAFTPRMLSAQAHFATSGGLHAAALFAPNDEIVCVREDVGRHNAVDKVLGWARTHELTPLHGYAMQVSGRAAAEIVHKAVIAGVSLLCAVSAPTTMAVDLARAANMTLVGFTRGGGLNIYSAPERIIQH